MPCPSANSPSMRLKKVRRSRKWLICRSQLFGGLGGGRAGGGRWPAALDVAQQPASPRVEPPSDDNAGEVEDKKCPQRRLRAAGETDGGAVTLGNKERAV